jgi:hypothetical protein
LTPDTSVAARDAAACIIADDGCFQPPWCSLNAPHIRKYNTADYIHAHILQGCCSYTIRIRLNRWTDLMQQRSRTTPLGRNTGAHVMCQNNFLVLHYDYYTFLMFPPWVGMLCFVGSFASPSNPYFILATSNWGWRE